MFNRQLENWGKRVALLASKVDVDALRKMCIFDLITNNTDRHARNCLFDPFTHKVWAIDNGLTFGRHFGFYYNVFHRFLFRHALSINSEERSRLESITEEQLQQALKRYLSPQEIWETHRRIQWVLDQPTLGFDTISRGRDGKDDFPPYKDWFAREAKKAAEGMLLIKAGK